MTMKKSIIFFTALLSLGACKKDISSLNDETKKPINVPAGTLLAYATKSYSDAITSASVNLNPWRFTSSQWAMTTYQDEARYDFVTRNLPDKWWSEIYTKVIKNLDVAIKTVTADETLTPGVKANQLAILDVLQVVAYMNIVNTYGDAPYTEALNQANFFPKYEDAKTISLDLIKRLNTDITNLKTAEAGFKSSEDILFKGDVAKWTKFANSIRLQEAMMLADVDNTTAKTAVEASVAGAIASPADNASFAYLPGAPNQNPLYVDIVTGGRGDYVAAADIVNKLKTLADPRLSQYITKNSFGEYVGGTMGSNNSMSLFSLPNPKTYAADAPTLFSDYVDAEFYRAEAVERGYAVSGSAAEHYNNAITASILYWGGTQDEATAYLATPAVNYATAAGDWKEKIGTQKWIASYNRPCNSWAELRRLDYPKVTAPVSARSTFPTRYTYPSVEQQLNPDNYTKAAAAIGGDKVTTKLFWDKF